ncbi:hypothetical protein KVR01_009656 [Diaporthe batatas]|uniref:uncharacterized protein n=1 Tax=Diaporthe batatas TaxID=748121 RepID=UPI001D053EC5|nr:uncharacterized protein KVR01_009656 [Diaporthe batatas]KAG8160120.1 hypothetical protein KVR01_009656 [Diaporthe batatas]
MRAVETRATPEKASQCEKLEEAGPVNRGADASEEALRVAAVKKLGGMRLEQVSLDVKKPSAAARRALFLEAMAERKGTVIRLSPDLRGNGGWGPGSTPRRIVRPLAEQLEVFCREGDGRGQIRCWPGSIYNGQMWCYCA